LLFTFNSCKIVHSNSSSFTEFKYKSE